ncbi:hypothetical protein CONLIGDRAFT_641156 [Coniochaeta ligniaria NRRL 30616]|uniref:F-box domain-containing protein n=1 Tax=Coniochaeta ligniaria NRRL 30616 TaxID=1408157 RepID=A0A1J7J3R0_9PEZI|nr:hypothetical protein CONLIGDRAFT_641156 [Coniochaeta ligniaria NRRL 30616]
MHFFDLPAEIRLKVYSELLVLEEPIPLAVEYGTPWRAVRRRHRGDGLCPALLRLNKKAHDEASPILYSQNTFRFPDLLRNIGHKTNVHTGVFLTQIGSNASLIRHITLPCPPNVVERDSSGFFQLPAGYIRNLELIRDICTSLSTIKLTMPMYVNIVFSEWPIAANLMDLLAPHLRDIPSLEDIVIELLLYDKIKNPKVDVNRGPLLKNVRDRGWTVQVTYAPSPQS